MPHWLKWAWGGISLRVHLHVSSECESVACAARSKGPLRLLLGGMKTSTAKRVLSSLQLTSLCTPFAANISEHFSFVSETFLVNLSSCNICRRCQKNHFLNRISIKLRCTRLMTDTDFRPELRTFRTPALILHGDIDKPTPIDWAPDSLFSPRKSRTQVRPSASTHCRRSLSRQSNESLSPDFLRQGYSGEHPW